MKKKKTVAIIGAGPAGLSAGYSLSKMGIYVEIFEKSASVGGMSKSISLWGQIVDLGPHRFFSSDPRVNKLWLEIVQNKYSMVKRLTRIFYKDKFFDYPIKPLNAFYNLGSKNAFLCTFSYLKSKILPPKDTSTFEGWVIKRFGFKLYTIFFKSYSEKLWGIPCHELDSDFAKQRIKKLSLFEAVKSALKLNSKHKHKTLVDEFAYPLFGTGMVYEEMKNRILKLGGKINLSTDIISVKASSNGSRPNIVFENQKKKSFDHIISTMPLTNLISKIGAPKKVLSSSKKLKFRNTILVYLKIQEPKLFPDQWIYIHSEKLKTGRITNFKNWTKSINKNKKDSILCLEYWCNDKDKLWIRKDIELVEIAIRDLMFSGLVKKDKIIDSKVIKIPKCYPVYSKGYKKNISVIKNFLIDLKEISVIGRYGSFKYNNQDHSILMGILAAENISGTNHNDLWALNTDYEYQESSAITQTGLIKTK